MKWNCHFCFGGQQFGELYGSLWNDAVKTNHIVGEIWPNDADGNAICTNLFPVMRRPGLTIVDPGGYQDGTADYSAMISVIGMRAAEANQS